MNNVILDDIKNLLGLKEVTAFDQDILININSVFMILNELGIGPKTGFTISGRETWSDFLGNDLSKLEAVRSYTYIKVRLIFDPPQSGTVMDSMKGLADELEWRLNVAVDPILIGTE